MREKLVVWKHRLLFVACLWTLLAFIFSMQRYGWLILSHDIYSVLWDKLGNFILLRWVSDTLITGFLAIFAAAIGAYYLTKVTQRQIDANKENLNTELQHTIKIGDAIEYRRKKSILSASAAIYGIISDELEFFRKNKIDIRHLWDITSKLSEVDGQIFWLSIAVNRKIEYAYNLPVKDIDHIYMVSFLQATAINDILVQLSEASDHERMSISKGLIDCGKIEKYLSERPIFQRSHLGELEEYYSWTD